MSALDNNTNGLQEILDTVKSMPAVERHAVRFTEQELTEEQQLQAQKNIGVDVPTIDLSGITNLAINYYTSVNVASYQTTELAAEIIANPPERAKIILPFFLSPEISAESIKSITIDAALTQHEAIPGAIMEGDTVCAYIGYVPNYFPTNSTSEDAPSALDIYTPVAVVFGIHQEEACVGVIHWSDVYKLFTMDLQYGEKAKAIARQNIGAAGFSDVAELPTDIDKNAFYRVPKAIFYANGTPEPDVGDCYVVETLPTTAETLNQSGQPIFYYAKDTGSASVYVTDEMASFWNYPAGWAPAEAFFDGAFGGIVYDKADITDAYPVFLLIETDLYAGSDRLVKASDSVQVFNLATMGVPDITGTATETAQDTTAMIAALERGQTLQLLFNINLGDVYPVAATVSNAAYSPVDSFWAITIFLGAPTQAPTVYIEIVDGKIRTQLY